MHVNSLYCGLGTLWVRDRRWLFILFVQYDCGLVFKFWWLLSNRTEKKYTDICALAFYSMLRGYRFIRNSTKICIIIFISCVRPSFFSDTSLFFFLAQHVHIFRFYFFFLSFVCCVCRYGNGSAQTDWSERLILLLPFSGLCGLWKAMASYFYWRNILANSETPISF